jgi:hypothetical protein
MPDSCNLARVRPNAPKFNLHAAAATTTADCLKVKTIVFNVQSRNLACMQPFVSVAASLVPELVPLVAGDRAGTLEATIIRTVTETTHASTAADARRLLTANDKLATQLQTRLKKIAAVAEKIQSDDVLLVNDDWAASPANGGVTGTSRPPQDGPPQNSVGPDPFSPSPAPFSSPSAPLSAPASALPGVALPTPPPPRAKARHTPSETALELRKLLLDERVLNFREAQFEREISRNWTNGPAFLISFVLGLAAICIALIITTKDVLQADAAKAAAQANERAANQILAAAQINAAAARAAKLAPKPVAAALPTPSPAPESAAQLQQDHLNKLLASDPHNTLSCAPAAAASRLKSLQAQYPGSPSQLAVFYLTDAATCSPADRKLTTTQSFYAAAAAAAEPLPLTTIFIRYPNPDQATIATALAAKLAQIPNLFLPPPTQTSAAIAPRDAETNYYTPADKPLATTITSFANIIPTMPHIRLNAFHESLRAAPSGVIEIWLPRS